MSAFLIPENIPTRGDLPPHLQTVAGALRDFLSEDVTVWLEGEEEPYLLIFDPGAGVLLLHVPSVEARGLRGRRVKMSSEQRPVEEVLALLRKRAGELEDSARVHELLKHDVQFAVGAAFPSVGREKAVEIAGSEQEAARFLAKEDFRPDELPDAIARLMAGGSIESLPDIENRAVRAVLHPEVAIHARTDSGAEPGQLIFRPPEEDEGDVVSVLDREQERLARRLDGGYRVIRGVAGSGKTLVLCFRARFLAESFPDWRILLTCYNLCLSKALEHQLSLRESVENLVNVEVRHIDSQVHSVLRKAHGHVRKANSPDDWQRMREDAHKALTEDRGLADFDAVLVDEGQDFDAAGLDVAWASLKDGRDQFVIALDAAQNIYRKRSRWNPPEMTARGRTTLMQTNYRNTKEILEFAWRFLAAGAETDNPDELLDDPGTIVPPEATSRRGPPPQVITCRDKQAEIEAICDLLEKRHAEGTPWGNMAVLYGNKNWQSQLYWRTKERGIPYFWVNMSSYNKKKVATSGDVVRAFTFHSAKGLEFSRVFLCGVNDIWDPAGDLESLRRLVYVGMTRAMDELVLMVSGQGEIGQAIHQASGS